MSHIINLLLGAIGFLIWNSKKIVQKSLRLDDSQAIHPHYAEDGVYERWHKYKRFSIFFDKYHLFYVGIILEIFPVIEVTEFINWITKKAF